jgi:hypothetical protein
VPDKYLSRIIPRVSPRSPVAAWIRFETAIPSDMPLRIKVQSDDMPEDVFEEVVDFTVRARRPEEIVPTP